MQSRQTLREQFSTFIQFEADDFSKWVILPKLERSINKCIQEIQKEDNNKITEKFLILYWHKIWQTQPQNNHLAELHFLAYLQEVCYWCAYGMKPYFRKSNEQLSDCFQIAIAQISKVLKGFNPEYNSSLKAYAKISFTNILKDTLRQRREIDLCSDWALLRKISKKRFNEALQAMGISTILRQEYQLAWHYLQQVYVPNTSQSEQQMWLEITELYQQDSNQNIQPEILKKWLTKVAQQVRNYLYPDLVSLNQPISSESSKELQDELLLSDYESLWSEIIAEEQANKIQQQQLQINNILTKTISQLDKQTQQLLNQYYSQGLTQSQIAKSLQIKQYTVSRRMTKAREILLLTLARYCQENWHISLTSNVDQYKQIITILEEWLQNYYACS